MHTHTVLHFCLAFSLCLGAFKDEVLKTHNKLRNIHGSKSLTLNETLSKKATEIAINAAKDGRFTPENSSGVNTYMLCATFNRKMTATEAVEAWYDEVCSKEFSFSQPNKESSHAFTQLVWKDTSLLGVGKAKKDEKNETCTFVVAMYRPAGNVVTKGGPDDNELFKENVNKGRFNHSYCENKFNTDKRHKISGHRRSTDDNGESNVNHKINRRSLYYRFPARFFIDPETGQTKAVAPEETSNPYTKSQLASPQFSSQPQYAAPGYMYGTPATPYMNENSFYGAATMPAGQYDYQSFSNNNYLGQKQMAGEISSLNEINSGKIISPSPVIVNNEHKKIVEGSKREKANDTMVASVRTLDDNEKKKLWDDALSMHNDFRAVHGTPPLEIDEELCRKAENVARDNAANNKMKHSGGDYGENLAFRCTSDKSVANVKDSIKDWYMEVCSENYDFEADLQSKALHFTQLVWKNTTKLGIGMATSMKDDMLCTYFVGIYTPKGNSMKQFVENVPKGSFDKEKTCNEQSNEDSSQEPNKQINPNATNDNKGQTDTTNTSDVNNGEGIAPKPQKDKNNVNNEENKPPKDSKNKGPEDKNGTSEDNGPPQDIKNGPPQDIKTETQEDEDEMNYEIDALKVINKFREIHNSGSLTADSTLHRKAKARTDSFVTGLVKREQRKQQAGENVQVACNPIDKVLPPEEAVSNWYREVCGKNYTFTDEGPQNAAHFTQLVWKESKKVGIAYSTKKKKSGDLCTVVVAIFDPVGNQGKFLDNVEKGRFDRSFCGSVNTLAAAAVDTNSPPDEYKPKDNPRNNENDMSENSVATNKNEQNSNNGESDVTMKPMKGDRNKNKGDDEDEDEDEDDEDLKNKRPNENNNVSNKTGSSTPPLKTVDLTKINNNEEETDFVQEVLTIHNALRSIHGSGLLTENPELTKKSKELADDIAQASREESNLPKQSADLDFGENVEEECFDEDKKLSGENAVFQWWSKGFCDDGEKDFKKKQLSPATQVVWNSSKELGVARTSFQKNGKFCTVVVALYSPKGNIEGELVENVKEGDFDYSTMCDDKNNTLQIAKELFKSPKDKEDTGNISIEKAENKGSSEEVSDFAKAGLEAHNNLRRIHKVPELKLNDEMTKSATEYAKKLADMGRLEHAPTEERNGDGENLAFSCSGNDEEYVASDPVGLWYGEVCHPGYNFKNASFSDNTGHFTQVVWKKSSELGLGFAKVKKNDTTCYYTVGRYKTAGNVQDDFQENVLIGNFSTQNMCNGTELRNEITHASKAEKRFLKVGSSLISSGHSGKRSQVKSGKHPKIIIKGIMKKNIIPSIKNNFKLHDPNKSV